MTLVLGQGHRTGGILIKPTVKLKVIGKKFPDDLLKALRKLPATRVLVGVPEAKAPRNQGTANNAMLAYIHDNGSPMANIPPRPFMKEGIANAQDDINKYLRQAGSAALDGDEDKMHRALTAVGLVAQKAIRRKIQTGPFTPLKPATVAARKRKHKSRSNTIQTPLIDTGQLLASINFVITDEK